jgi:hypothetical protein
MDGSNFSMSASAYFVPAPSCFHPGADENASRMEFPDCASSAATQDTINKNARMERLIIDRQTEAVEIWRDYLS